MKRFMVFVLLFVLLFSIYANAEHSYIDEKLKIDEGIIADHSKDEIKLIDEILGYEKRVDYPEKLSTGELLSRILENKPLLLLTSCYEKIDVAVDVAESYSRMLAIFLSRKDCKEELIRQEEKLRGDSTSLERAFVVTLLQSSSSVPNVITINDIFYSLQYTAANSPVRTSSNIGIPLYHASRTLNSTEQDYFNSLLNYFPSAYLNSPPSSYYNCHSYAWASSPYKTSYWIEDPSPLFGANGDYGIDLYPGVGTKVLYFSSTAGVIHSAVITQTASSFWDFTLLSKWGQGVLSTHKPAGCPYAPQTSNYLFYDTISRVGIKKIQAYINSNLPSTYLGTPLAIDGGFGPATKTAAIKLLQYWLNTRYNAGLTVDGGFGNLTYNACVTVAQGDSGMGVYILQGLLYGNGYNPKGFDGSFGVNGGTGCLMAVRAFQGDNGLAVDGRAGKNTFRALCN